jgi:hypothetical protein
MRRRAQLLNGRVAMILAGLAFSAGVCFGVPATAGADETVVACGPQPNGVFLSSSAYIFTMQAACPGGTITVNTGQTVGFKKGQNAIWQAVAPTGLAISSASIPSMTESGVNAGTSGDYGGDFYWASGSSNIVPGESSASFPGINSRDFGFNLVCGLSTCSGANAYAGIWVSEVVLDVAETSGQSLSSPSGLWQATGWVRGKWNLSLSGDSPSGMCSLSASLAGQPLPGSTSQLNQAVWHQCSAAAINDPVETADYPQGAQTLRIAGTDAAGAQPALSKTVDIDNQQPTVTLNGPADAPSTAGTEYVTATASAGPSGVAGISCSLDGAPAQWFAASTAQIAVSAIGTHQVQCTAENNAVDSAGAHGSSAPATYSVRIGIPTVAVVAFSKVVNKLRCHHVTERVHIPARWVKVRVRGRLERVREKAHTQKIKVTRCHARTVRRRITHEVTVRRHGKKVRVKRTRVVRVVVEPRTVFKTSRRVRHGHGTVVDGWLGTATGTALAGQTVEVLTAADNGRESFHVAAVTTTAANGGWSARLAAGPSRLVEASYPGAASTEGAISAPAHLIVPAKVQLLSVSPRRVAWGGVVHLVGRLKGGYLPHGGALVRLRIGLGHSDTTYGVREHVTGSGRFRTDYTFGAGDPATHRSFWFQIASLPMGDYPYAPAQSRRLTVTVGGHPRPCRRSPKLCM